MGRRRLVGALALLIAAGAQAQELAQAGTAVHTGSPPPLAEPAEDGEGPAVDLSVVYVADVWGVARGGLRRGTRYLDNLDVTLTVDGGRALGWDGATVFLYGLYNNGRSLSGDLVGDLQVASNIDAGTRAVRLYEAWVEQRFAGGRGSVKVGLYDVNSEFDTNESNVLFINSSHGIGPDFSQSGRNGPSIFPSTSLGVRADFRLTENWLVRAAVLDGVPGDPERPGRTLVRLGGGDGALLVGEVEWSDPRTKVAAGHWRYTARFEKVSGAPERRGNDGFYMFAERRLSAGERDAPGLSGWVRLGFADPAFNPVESYIGGGLVYGGLLPGRPEDRLGIAVASVRLGGPARRALALAGEASDARETNIELTYRAVVAPWLTLQPDVQYIVNPGANPALRDAIVVGLRAEVGF